MSQKIGFVGVGRMGANMARRLQETGFVISAVFDANREAAGSLAKELNCVAAMDLKSVTALSEIVITVVSDVSTHPFTILPPRSPLAFLSPVTCHLPHPNLFLGNITF